MNHKKILFVIVLLISGINIANGQDMKDIKKDIVITKSELKAVISDVCQHLKTNYVFPEIADKMVIHLNQNLESGVYDALSDPGEISARLSKDIVEISKDKHLRVLFDPKMNEDLQRSDVDRKPEPEVLEKWINNERKGNFGFSKVEILEGNIGLITLKGFSGFIEEGAGAIADATMAYVSNSDAIIFDLRSNGGGSPDMIIYLTSYLLKDAVHINSFYYRATDKIRESWTTKEVKGKKMDKTPVYILTSNRTFSAAEEFTYNLKHLERATIVGEVTGGGANPGDMMAVDKNFVMFVATGRAINPITQTNWEGVGVIPNIKTSKDKALESAHIAALKSLVKNASGSEKEYLELVLSNKKALSKNIKITVGDLQKYMGDYGGEMQPSVTIDKGQLAIGANGRKMTLQCIGEDLFVTEDNIRIQFEKDDKGGIVGLKILMPKRPTMNCPKK